MMTINEQNSLSDCNDLDHLIVAAETLQHGSAYIHELLGVLPTPGGQHRTMGTHNMLVKLGPKCYLEIIAIDPTQSPPARPRWFGLDRTDVQQLCKERPRLLHWVARTPKIKTFCQASATFLGPPQPMQRGQLQWQLTIPADGSLPFGGLFPSVIEWQTDEHPAEQLPDQGCKLVTLEATCPDPGHIHRALTEYRLNHLIDLHKGSNTRIKATINTPDGLRFLQ